MYSVLIPTDEDYSTILRAFFLLFLVIPLSYPFLSTVMLAVAFGEKRKRKIN